MTQEEVDGLVKTIFNKREMFEKYVLHVISESDREEVMYILSSRIIRALLKEDFSFLNIKELKPFNFPIIVNILFKEIANEWVTFAEERMEVSKEDALEVIQKKKNTVFIFSMVKDYYGKYKIIFAEEIAETFLELIESMPNPMFSNPLIDEVLKSGFVKNNNTNIVYNYSQLWNRVKSAHNNKKRELVKLQIKIGELAEYEVENESLIRKLEIEEAILEKKSLALFDQSVKRLRDTMVNYMMKLSQ